MKLLGKMVLLGFFCAGTFAADEGGSAFGRLFKRVVTNLVTVQTNAPTATNSIGTNIISSAPAGTNALKKAALDGFSNLQLNDAAKLAVSNGLTRAVMTLGHTNGFLTNLNVKIAMPPALVKTEKTLRDLGQGQVVDNFIATMNRAAEQAVPEAAPVFGNMVAQMTLGDVRSLLTADSKSAVTDFVRKSTTNELSQKFSPIVQKATASVGVTSAYKQLTAKLGFASALLSDNAGDIDQYVTAKALDGLFKMVAEEEKHIRENPQGQATALLQKVFGALQR